jgi:hypothetical protein
MMKRVFYSCLALPLICVAASAQARKWSAPTYQGLTLGKSKRANVERAFGKPAWSGHPEDGLDNPMENFLSYEYDNVGGFDGRTVVIMGRHSGVVQVIYVYPSPQRPLSRSDAVQRYGGDYVERESSDGPCPMASELRHQRPAAREYPIFLAYPEKGVYFSVQSDGTVLEIGYMLRCPWP